MTSYEEFNPQGEYSALTTDEKKTHLAAYFTRLHEGLNTINMDDVQKALDMVEDAYINHRKLFVAGNGGSRATASHFVTDMMKTIFGYRPIPAIWARPFDVTSLGDNIPTMTATANDYSYDEVFSLPLMAKGQEGDLLLVITGKGNSVNIVKVLEVARKRGIKTLGFLGFDGKGKAAEYLDHSVIVHSDDYGVIEDVHTTLMHVITDYFKTSISKWFDKKITEDATVESQPTLRIDARAQTQKK